MTGSLGRGGRRRRVLNEEVIASSSSHQVMRRASDDAHAIRNGPRYSDAAAAENQPPLIDFVPGRLGAMVLAMLAGVSLLAALELLHYFGGSIAHRLGDKAAAALDLAAPASLASWLSAAVLMAAGVICLLIYSMRRHRIDDFRGRYRIWCWAALACVVLSINSVARLHLLASGVMEHLVGWTMLRDGAVWWIGWAALLFGWIAVRAFLDCRESRFAAVAFIGSMSLYAVGIAAHLGVFPVVPGPIEPMVVVGTQLLGNMVLLLALVAYVRYVSLDAQGQIHHAAAKTKRQARPAAPATIKLPTMDSKPVAQPRGESARSAGPSPMLQKAGQTGLLSTVRAASLKLAQQQPDDDRWVDGSRPVRDQDGDDDSSHQDRKLSKAERKQLRKLKAQNRAA